MSRRASILLGAMAVITLACSSSKSPETVGEKASAARNAVVPEPSASADDPIAEPSPSGPRAEPAPSEQTPEVPPSITQAKRTRVRRIDDDPRLARNKQTLVDHFSDHLGILPTPLETQTVVLAGEREAKLLAAPPPDRRPFILVTARDGALLWTKDSPLAGIAPGIVELAMTTGPEGDVVLSWFDTPTRVLALRRWDAKGGILADFELLDLGPCEAVSLLYWPGYGWLAAAAQLGSARLQRLNEGARLVWGPDGKSLPWASKPDAPIAVALDTEDSAILLQVGFTRGRAGNLPGHLLAIRINAEGTELWPRLLDLGPAPPITRGDRLVMTRTSPGVVRASIGGWTISLTSEGAVRR